MRREQKSNKSDKSFLLGFIFNCKAELKLLLAALLVVCSLATLFPFLPTTFFFSSSSSCLSTVSAVSATNATSPPPRPLPLPLPLPQLPSDQILDNGVFKRSLIPYGVAAYNFILMSAYRGGVASFAITGLASKPLHVFSRPSYTCEYRTNLTSISVPGYKILPDWGFGRVYTTVVINCTFPSTSAASDPTTGGTLIINATTNGGYDRNVNQIDTITSLVEHPNSWNLTRFLSPPKYEYLYCGSPLYGNLSPQRVREWIAYHTRLFGKDSHFIIYDAGGVHPDVMDVLRPWIELGYITVHDVKEQERFDGYYHNQFVIVNDCLHRYRFDAKWIFFFDLDEFIYVNPKLSLKSAMDASKEYTQITFDQMLMSNKLCLTDNVHKMTNKWGFEKLVYRDMTRVSRRDRKYAIQPRNVFATGVHKSQNFQGNSTYMRQKLMSYFHYHGTIVEHRELCRRLVNETSIKFEGSPYTLDKTLESIASLVKRFELNTIGSSLKSTRQ